MDELIWSCNLFLVLLVISVSPHQKTHSGYILDTQVKYRIYVQDGFNFFQTSAEREPEAFSKLPKVGKLGEAGL